MHVHQILKSKATQGVLTIKPESRIKDAVELLAKKKIGAVVVSPDGKKVDGILSERDVVRALGEIGGECLTQKAGDLMTSDPVTCGLEDSSEAVFRLMTEGRFRHLPVLQNGEMVGLISIGDVVKAQLSELSMEKSALEGMIMGY